MCEEPSLRGRNVDATLSNANGQSDTSAMSNCPERQSLLVDNSENISSDHTPGRKAEQEADWRRDKENIALLVFLYILQGIPLGLAGSIPLILQQRGVSYKGQATFSLVFWPFTFKLLWAPFVDGIYSRRMGRRKSWLVPVQYSIGLVMMWLSFTVDAWIGSGSSSSPQMTALTVAFFALNTLAATQDIAVDGWALTMLKARNVGYASTCNSVGQTAGYFLGNVVFLALESADFCNNYIRLVPQPYGIVTLDTFLMFWGVVFIITTSLVWLLKVEKKEHVIQRRHSNDSEEYPGGFLREDSNEGRDRAGMPLQEAEAPGILTSYRQLVSILKLHNIRMYILFVIFSKVGVCVADSLTGLKLIEYGVPKEKLALLGVPVVPLQIILPVIISRYTAGPRPLSVYMYAYIPRLLFGLAFAWLVSWTRQLGIEYGTGNMPTYFYLVVVGLYCLHQVTVYSMFVAIMAFHARISDPRMGGTYMTLLNTISNLASNWPSMVAMWFVDTLTTRQCIDKNGNVLSASCPVANSEACTKADGTCSVVTEGYYYEMAACILFGFVWAFYHGRKLLGLQEVNLSAWRVAPTAQHSQ